MPEPAAAAHAFAGDVAAKVRGVLGERVVGVYVGGSLALGDYAPGRSDIDMAVIVADGLAEAERDALVAVVVVASMDCPTRGLELVVYTRAAAAEAAWPPGFEVNIDAGPQMPVHVGFDPDAEPAHWFAIDLAVLREHGVAIYGPPPAEIFGEPERAAILRALGESLAWHSAHERASPGAVLNACRAWRYAEEGVWSSKADAATWLRARSGLPVIEAALRAREVGGAVDPDAAHMLIGLAEDALAAAA